MSSEIKTVTGRGIPVRGNDIDTDRIIPARFLRCVSFDGLGEHAFADDRSASKGEHPFDRPEYREAKVLVVNGNFGCGSSREHAPQAIARWGIEAIVGESFAEIFFGNCVAIGVPCLTADTQSVKQLQDTIAANPQLELTVDLEVMQVRAGDLIISVILPDGPRNMLTTGTWDTCGQLVTQAEEIRATAAKLPYVSWQTV
jgi:3-isopropylmalate/(R)-2-methylmalate dehydratase small subunit